jgi:hypothetical protein
MSDEGRECPYCAFVAHSTSEEVAHMSTAHPEEVNRRLAQAGIPEVVDYRQGPDLPSYLTLLEWRQVAIWIERYAVEQAWDLHQYNPQISILVRDRGEGSAMPAAWIEFSVGEQQFAIWRNTGDLYRVGQDGAVEDDPIHRND